MPGLSDCPHEVIGNIVDRLDCRSVKALRLTCRTVERGSIYRFVLNFCQIENVHFRDAQMNVASAIPGFTLDDLERFSHKKDFCGVIKRLNFIPIHSIHLSGLATYQRLADDNGQISDDENMREWGSICIQKLGDMNQRINNLAEMLGQLSNLEEVFISDVAYIRLNNYSFANDEGITIGPIVKTILAAISQSGTKLKSLRMLDFKEVVHQGGMDISDLYVLQPSSDTFGFLRTLSLVLTNGCCYFGTINIDEDHKAWEYLPSFLSETPNLEELRLEIGWAQWYEEFVYLFKAIAKSVVLPSLKTLHLDGVVLDQKDMTAFAEAHKDSLENLSLLRAWVRSDEDPDSFWTLFKDLRDKLNLKSLSVIDLGVDEGGIYFENLSYNFGFEDVTDELGEDGWALVHWAETDSEVNIDESLDFKAAMTELINGITVMLD